MKIGIITFHRARNYGAVLQAYAIMRFINDVFPEVKAEIIDYRSKYIEDFYDPDNPKNSFHAKIVSIISKKRIKQRNQKFQDFVDKYFALSPECDAGTIGHIRGYDKYISGSDMLWHWHTTGEGKFFDKAYFLDFVQESDRKYSYAASFGFDKMPEEYKAFYAKQLREYKYISVREASAIGIIKELTGKDAVCNADPTMLFDASEWRKLEKKPEQERYVLLYEVGGISKKLKQCAEKIANEKGLKCVVLYSEYNPVQFYKYKGGVFGCSPEEFLGWFDNAEYIVTNSFHGTVFAVIYHKKLFVEIDAWSKNNRAYELMAELGLEARTIDNGYDMSFEIDWDQAERKLEQFRWDAKEYLKKIIG